MNTLSMGKIGEFNLEDYNGEPNVILNEEYPITNTFSMGKIGEFNLEDYNESLVISIALLIMV